MLMVWIIAILFLVLSVILLSGHGGFLLAGYNTCSPAKKAKYDEKKLCRVNGIGMLFITIMLFLMAAFEEALPDWFTAFFIIATFMDVIVMIFVTNTRCYVKNLDGGIASVSEEQISAADIKRSKIVEKGSILFTLILFTFSFILLATGDITFQCEEDRLIIEASYYPDLEISYNEIQTIELCDGYLKGSRSGGFGSFRLQMGGFENKEYGSYTRYTYTDCRGYIVIRLKDRDNPLLIAAQKKEKTEQIYKELVRQLNN